MSVASRSTVAGLALELTRQCNQSCAYCYNPERSAERPALVGALPELVLGRLSRLMDGWSLGSVTLNQ